MAQYANRIYPDWQSAFDREDPNEFEPLSAKARKRLMAKLTQTHTPNDSSDPYQVTEIPVKVAGMPFNMLIRLRPGENEGGTVKIEWILEHNVSEDRGNLTPSHSRIDQILHRKLGDIPGDMAITGYAGNNYIEEGNQGTNFFQLNMRSPATGEELSIGVFLLSEKTSLKTFNGGAEKIQMEIQVFDMVKESHTRTALPHIDAADNLDFRVPFKFYALHKEAIDAEGKLAVEDKMSFLTSLHPNPRNFNLDQALAKRAVSRMRGYLNRNNIPHLANEGLRMGMDEIEKWVDQQKTLAESGPDNHRKMLVLRHLIGRYFELSELAAQENKRNQESGIKEPDPYAKAQNRLMRLLEKYIWDRGIDFDGVEAIETSLEHTLFRASHKTWLEGNGYDRLLFACKFMLDELKSIPQLASDTTLDVYEKSFSIISIKAAELRERYYETGRSSKALELHYLMELKLLFNAITLFSLTALLDRIQTGRTASMVNTFLVFDVNTHFTNLNYWNSIYEGSPDVYAGLDSSREHDPNLLLELLQKSEEWVAKGADIDKEARVNMFIEQGQANKDAAVIDTCFLVLAIATIEFGGSEISLALSQFVKEGLRLVSKEVTKSFIKRALGASIDFLITTSVESLIFASSNMLADWSLGREGHGFGAAFWENFKMMSVLGIGNRVVGPMLKRATKGMGTVGKGFEYAGTYAFNLAAFHAYSKVSQLAANGWESQEGHDDGVGEFVKEAFDIALIMFLGKAMHRPVPYTTKRFNLRHMAPKEVYRYEVLREQLQAMIEGGKKELPREEVMRQVEAVAEAEAALIKKLKEVSRSGPEKEAFEAALKEYQAEAKNIHTEMELNLLELGVDNWQLGDSFEVVDGDIIVYKPEAEAALFRHLGSLGKPVNVKFLNDGIIEYIVGGKTKYFMPEKALKNAESISLKKSKGLEPGQIAEMLRGALGEAVAAFETGRVEKADPHGTTAIPNPGRVLALSTLLRSLLGGRLRELMKLDFEAFSQEVKKILPEKGEFQPTPAEIAYLYEVMGKGKSMQGLRYRAGEWVLDSISAVAEFASSLAPEVALQFIAQIKTVVAAGTAILARIPTWAKAMGIGISFSLLPFNVKAGGLTEGLASAGPALTAMTIAVGKLMRIVITQTGKIRMVIEARELKRNMPNVMQAYLELAPKEFRTLEAFEAMMKENPEWNAYKESMGSENQVRKSLEFLFKEASFAADFMRPLNEKMSEWLETEQNNGNFSDAGSKADLNAELLEFRARIAEMWSYKSNTGRHVNSTTWIEVVVAVGEAAITLRNVGSYESLTRALDYLVDTPGVALKGKSINGLKAEFDTQLNNSKPIDAFDAHFSKARDTLKKIASGESSVPLPKDYFTWKAYDRHLYALRESGRATHIEKILFGDLKLPDHLIQRIRELLADPALSKGKRYLNRIADHINKKVNNAIGEELAKITTPEAQSKALQQILEIWPTNDLWVISERLIEHDKRLQAELYGDMFKGNPNGKILFIPQVELPLSGLPGSHKKTRSPDFLVYLVPGKNGPMVRVIILDIKTGYENTPVDAVQAQDYFLAVEKFYESSAVELQNQIHKQIVEAHPEYTPDMIDLVQVDWLFMPGKSQAGSMSAREVAIGKVEQFSKVKDNLQIKYNIFFYEGGSIKNYPIQ